MHSSSHWQSTENILFYIVDFLAVFYLSLLILCLQMMDLLSTYNDENDDDDNSDEDDGEIDDKRSSNDRSCQTHTADQWHSEADTNQCFNLPQHHEQLSLGISFRLKNGNSNVVDNHDISSSQVEQPAAICNLPPLLQPQNAHTTLPVKKAPIKENLTSSVGFCIPYRETLPSSLLLKDDVTSSCHGSSVIDYFNLCDNSFETLDDNGAVNPDDSTNLGSFQCQRNVKACRGSSSVDFWNTVSPACNWEQCERIWGVPGDKVESSSVTNIQSTTDDQCKRKKLLKDYSQSDSYASASVKLKPCFVLHYKIAPHLQDARMNKLICRHPKKVIAVLPGHAGTVNRINWCTAEYGQLLLSASMDSTVRIWNVFSSSSDSCVRTLKCHAKAVKDAVWIDSGKQIISCGYDKTARISDVEHGQ